MNCFFKSSRATFVIAAESRKTNSKKQVQDMTAAVAAAAAAAAAAVKAALRSCMKFCRPLKYARRALLM